MTRTDHDLHARLVDLANAIRDIPPGSTRDRIVQRFFAVVRHLEEAGLIEQGAWNLRPLAR